MWINTHAYVEKHACTCGYTHMHVHMHMWINTRAYVVYTHACVDKPTEMSGVSNGRHVCCAEQQRCLLCRTADMSALPNNSAVCCVEQQKCLLRRTAEMCVVSKRRDVCCVDQERVVRTKMFVVPQATSVVPQTIFVVLSLIHI